MTGPNRPGRWRIDMTEQEQLRQLKEEYENMIIPKRDGNGCRQVSTEPDGEKRVEHARRRSAWTAVAAAAVVMIALPNTNIQIAHAMEIFRCWVAF